LAGVNTANRVQSPKIGCRDAARCCIVPDAPEYGTSVPSAVRRFSAGAIECGLAIDETDGLGMEFADWRFNLRASQTEPLLRLNVETRGNPDLLEKQTQALLQLMDQKA
jgi:phosphomannomutase